MQQLHSDSFYKLSDKTLSFNVETYPTFHKELVCLLWSFGTTEFFSNKNSQDDFLMPSKLKTGFAKTILFNIMKCYLDQ